MHLLSLLSLLSLISLALASPHTKRQSCVAEPWAIQGFTTFTADPGPTGISQLAFTFTDPNTNTTGSRCGRSLALGSGKSAADPNRFYPCKDPSISYRFDGENLALQHTFDCDG